MSFNAIGLPIFVQSKGVFCQNLFVYYYLSLISSLMMMFFFHTHEKFGIEMKINYIYWLRGMCLASITCLHFILCVFQFQSCFHFYTQSSESTERQLYTWQNFKEHTHKKLIRLNDEILYVSILRPCCLSKTHNSLMSTRLLQSFDLHKQFLRVRCIKVKSGLDVNDKIQTDGNCSGVEFHPHFKVYINRDLLAELIQFYGFFWSIQNIIFLEMALKVYIFFFCKKRTLKF